MIIHDDKPSLLAAVEDIIKGEWWVTHVKTGSYSTIWPIVKLYPLEVSSGSYDEYQDKLDDAELSRNDIMRDDVCASDVPAILQSLCKKKGCYWGILEDE